MYLLLGIAWEQLLHGDAVKILCDGIICCYGSRIRDYMDVIPKCPTLLVFAKYDSFDVDSISYQLSRKQNIQIEILDANHGFIDIYSNNYSDIQTKVFTIKEKVFCLNV